VEPVVVEQPRLIVVERPVEPETVEQQAAPPAVFKPVRPKTLYVIPLCYAGDKRPDPKILPAGCDVRDVKVIRPGT
jgi:hypothetical protein